MQSNDSTVQIAKEKGGYVFDLLFDMANQFMKAIPGVLGSIMLLIIGWIVASLLSKLSTKLSNLIGLDKLGNKLQEVDIIRKNNINIAFDKIIGKTIYYIVIIFFAVAAASVLGIPEISELMSNLLTNVIPNLILAFIILIFGLLLANLAKDFVSTALKSLGVGSANIIASAVFFFILINIVIVALSQANIDTAFLARNLSIIIGGVVVAFSLGYGLASKDVMSNFVSSIYNKDLFKVGDKITIEGVTGTVSEVTKSSVIIETENSTVRFPLNKAVSGKIEFHK